MNRPQPKFKKHPNKLKVMDLEGTFSQVPYRVMHIEDIRMYIHTKLEEYNHTNLGKIWVD